MSSNVDEFQYLLQGMRASFLDDLQEKCDGFDNLLLQLEKQPDDRAAFDDLYRGVHSLKGSGGTYGLPIITSICHQLEDCLAGLVGKGSAKTKLERVFKYVDLLRRVEAPGRTESPDFSDIEKDLEKLRQAGLQSKKICLVAEQSAMMVRVFQAALKENSIQTTVVGNGLEALSRLMHEPFDLAIIGRELPDLNGIAVVAALRASQGKNHKMPVILVTSNQDGIPAHTHINAILSRNNRLPASLGEALGKLKL